VTVETRHIAVFDPESHSPVLVDFVRDFGALLCLSKELDAVERTSLSEHLFKVGTQVKEGKSFWTKTGMNAIIQWKKLQPLRRRIEQGSVELEK
jgi:hypothetical protein